MTDKKLRVAIDIGTTKVCTIIGVESSSSSLEILGVGSHPSFGLKKGSVINIEKTVRSIMNSIEEAKLMGGIGGFTTATIGIAGNHIYSFNSSGVVAIKNKTITEEDVERVIDAAKAIVIPSDREIIHVIAQEFKVDNPNDDNRIDQFYNHIHSKPFPLIDQCLFAEGREYVHQLLQQSALHAFFQAQGDDGEDIGEAVEQGGRNDMFLLIGLIERPEERFVEPEDSHNGQYA